MEFQNRTLFNVADGRHFENQMLDFTSRSSENNLIGTFERNLVSHILRLTKILDENVTSLSSSDLSIYTGLSGIAFYYLKLASADPQLFESSLLISAADSARRLLRRCFRHLNMEKLYKNVSVFTSATGPLCVGALLSAVERVGSAEPAPMAISAKQCFEQYLAAHTVATSLKSGIPDEALYGRTGYLNGLLLLHSAGWSVPTAVFSGVCEAILRAGRQTAEMYQTSGTYKALLRDSPNRNLPMPPLMFEWHEKAYLGGAHGFAGILTTLLKVNQICPAALPPDSIEQLVLPTTKWLAELQLPSGNWPSSLGGSSERDLLVHWCHGATGVVFLMLSAYKVTGTREFLDRALNAGETIWARGLLHKGCGLCHGSAGSGYALLAIYQTTLDPKYLHRAIKFAEWCTDCFNNSKRVADRPYSLFEGLSGTLYFLVDVLDPENARYPILSGI